MTRVQTNSTGADWSDESLKREYERVDFADNLVATVNRLMRPKSGIPRKGILVFTRFIEEAYTLKEALCGDAEVVTGDTPKNERERILSEFKSGIIKVVINVSVLAVGFDYPELDTIVLARPTKSLALYYQIVGRAIRHYPNKIGWIVDLSGTYQQFGKVEDLTITNPDNDGRWAVESKGTKLTNVFI
jgi:DNA repair protein RadD